MKHLGIICGSLMLLTTASCGLNSAFDNSPTRPSDPRAYCTQLKRQIVFYSFNQNHDTAWSSPAQQARILKEFRDNRCDDLLNTDPDSDFRPHLPRSLAGNDTPVKVAVNNSSTRQKS